MYHLNLSQRREEYKDGTVSIFDLRGNDAICLTFNPESKRAVIMKYIGFGSKKDPDIISMVKQFEQESIERLGTKEQNGKILYGFRYKPNEYNDFTVWVDSNRELPVEIEIKHPKSEFGEEETVFMDEFEFDFNLDSSAFSTEPPDGYEVETKIENSKN